MESDAGFGAIAFNRATAAERRDRPAEILAEWDQEIVELNPIAGGQLFAEGHLRLLRRLCFDISQPV